MTLKFIYRHSKAAPICLKISNFYNVIRKWMDSTINPLSPKLIFFFWSKKKNIEYVKYAYFIDQNKYHLRSFV